MVYNIVKWINVPLFFSTTNDKFSDMDLKNRK